MTIEEKARIPHETRQRWGRLASVFSAGSDKELPACIACLCVLFEDLKVEIAGISEDDLGELDQCGKNSRRLYFLRRSIATLHEFTGDLDELDRLPAFQPIRARFHKAAQRNWARALTYFQRHDRYIARMRHNVGGHFGKQAADAAVHNLLKDAVGSIEIVVYGPRAAGAKLHFANEIAATAALRNIPGSSSQTKARKMMRRAIIGYRHAVRAVDCIIANYLWQRFGN